MLLPPMLVASCRRSVVVDAAKGDTSGPGVRKSGGKVFDSSAASSGGGTDSDVSSVASITAERFAEAFGSASVLFAEGAGGFARYDHHLVAFLRRLPHSALPIYVSSFSPIGLE